jgi:hypothetical protein
MKTATQDIYSYISTIASDLGVPPGQILQNLSVADAESGSTLRSEENLHVTDDLSERLVLRYDLRDELREHLGQSASEIGVEIFDNKGLRWAHLLRILADEQAYIDNYPDILIPGKGYCGIRSLTLDEQQLLLNALNATHHQCAFKLHSANAGMMK